LFCSLCQNFIEKHALQPDDVVAALINQSFKTLSVSLMACWMRLALWFSLNMLISVGVVCLVMLLSHMLMLM
jgi:hypothetical protein